jgi:hypothetical protein
LPSDDDFDSDDFESDDFDSLDLEPPESLAGAFFFP